MNRGYTITEFLTAILVAAVFIALAVVAKQAFWP